MVAERDRGVDALREAHAQLELRVRQRTTDLGLTNEALRRENEERQQAEQALRQVKKT